MKIRICVGTTCVVMGGADRDLLSAHLSEAVRSFVEVEEVRCLGLCKEGRFGEAPFVTLDGEVLSAMALPELVGRIEAAVRGGRA